MARWLLYASILLFNLCFGLTMASAATVDFIITPIKDSIDWNDTAIYSLKIINSGPSEYLEIRPANLNWGYIKVEPSKIFVPNGGFAEVALRISPPPDIKAGPYAVEVKAYSSSKKELRGSALVKLNVISEQPHLVPQWGIPEKIVPGQTKVNLIVKNDGALPVPETKGVLNSPLLSNPIELKIPSLKAGEAALVWNSQLDIPTNTKVGVYPFKLNIYKDNILVSENKYNTYIVPKESIKVDVSKTKSFLGTGYTVVLENVGNTEAINYYKIQIPSWQKLFLHTQLKPEIQKLENAFEIAWPFYLNVGEKKIIKYQISYVPLLALLLAILFLSYVGAWYFRQELILTKNVLRSEKALRVKISVKNNSSKPLQHVIVEDNIPTPLKLVKADHRPALIKSAEGAAKLFWKYDVLWPGEEKNITYDVKSALNIVGAVILPPAKGKHGKGRETKTYISNSVLIRSKPPIAEFEEEY